MEDHRTSGTAAGMGAPWREAVVVIEENEVLRDLFATFLESEGHFVLVTGDPEEGITEALEGNALVITELIFQATPSGLYLPLELRHRGFDGPVVILTTCSHPEVGVLAEHTGAARRLKPVRPSEIKSAMQEARRLCPRSP